MSNDSLEPIEPMSHHSEGIVADQFQHSLAALSTARTLTYAIIAANVLVFGVMVARGVDFVFPDGNTLLNWGANFGPVTMNGQWWRLLTYMFLHYGIVHIAMNMWVLWSLAPTVERFAGKAGFGIAYIVSGIAGGIVSLAWNPVGISAGASGAVFGVAGTLLGFVALRSDTIPRDVRNRMLKSMVSFLVLNTVVGMSAPQIDLAAHIGGFAAGVLCGLILSQPLSAEMIPRRKYRNLILVTAAGILLPLGMVALPAAMPDINTEMQRLTQVETQVYEAYNEAQDLSARGVIDDIEFADRIELRVLRLWAPLCEKVDGFLSLEYADKEYLKDLLRYLRCREESWTLLAQGLREHDKAMLQRSNALSIECDGIIQQLMK